MSKELEQIKAEIKRLQDQHCASPEVVLDTIYTFVESLEEQAQLRRFKEYKEQKNKEL